MRAKDRPAAVLTSEDAERVMEVRCKPTLRSKGVSSSFGSSAGGRGRQWDSSCEQGGARKHCDAGPRLFGYATYNGYQHPTGHDKDRSRPSRGAQAQESGWCEDYAPE
jgi:hypothetical protein